MDVSTAKKEPTWSEVQKKAEAPASPFILPFASLFSFAPLVRKIEETAESSHGAAVFAQQILERLEAVPELKEPIRDLSILSKHQELVDMLLSCIVPPTIHDQYLIKISRPFSTDDIYKSPRLQKLNENGEVKYALNKTDTVIFCATLVKAGSMILNKYYGQHIELDPPIMVSMQDGEKELPHFFKANMDLSLIDIKVNGDLPMLTQQEIDGLLSNIYDTDRWLKALPASKFEFHGFAIISMLDITTEEALSQIKHHLLRRDAILDAANIEELEQLMRIYLGVPDLRLGVTAIDYPLDRTVAHKYKIRFDLLKDQFENLLASDYKGSIYEKVCKYREVMLVEDLTRVKNKTALEQALLDKGFRSLILATLLDAEENVIGLVELASPHPYGLHSFIELKFKEIVGLFRTAVRRSREEVDNAIEAIIREQYTALHTSVEWRFVEEAFQILEKRSKGEPIDRGKSIVFKDVYPLYGQADIVGSSTKRNESIRADLITELTSAREVLVKAKAEVAFPLIDQTLLHLDRELQHLNDTFNSNDETRILELIQSEIQPLLRQLSGEYPDLAPLVTGYFNLLDNDLGIVYDRRKNYEQSVEAINELIGSYLDKENEEMQGTLPHYFERYKTDGVEYNQYVGQSLLRQEGVFSDLHLRNFRLWQLIQMCEITRQVESHRHSWPEPLTTAQLVFAYTTPLSIRFRMDEKRFDVDGAYNVRYEILKKRIDKAVIEGTSERITKSGHVTIVYLQEKDRQEYLQYADYLLYHGYITEPPHDYELGALQGVQGLRALRMHVKL
ncbi:MAG: hypothetical protein AAFN81_13425 [Bacteroidota bacterium]